MRDYVVVEDLDEALAGESGFINLGCVVGAEERVGGLADEIEKRMNGKFRCGRWELGATRELSRELHVIPLVLSLENKAG